MIFFSFELVKVSDKKIFCKNIKLSFTEKPFKDEKDNLVDNDEVILAPADLDEMREINTAKIDSFFKSVLL